MKIPPVDQLTLTNADILRAHHIIDELPANLEDGRRELALRLAVAERIIGSNAEHERLAKGE